MFTIPQLEQKAKQFAKEYWGLEFNLPIIINSRLTRTLGKYIWERNIYTSKFAYPIRLELSKNLLEKYKEEIIDSIIKHELTHWALSIQGKPFNDGHSVFERELKRVNAHSTNAISHVGEMHLATCKKCGKIVAENTSYRYVQRRIDNPRLTTSCCNVGANYAGTKIVGQEFAAQPQRIIARKQERVSAIQTAPSHVNHLVTPGPRGVTNKQMIPAIRESIDANSRERLEVLKKHYPDIFEGTLRYIGKSYYTQFEKLMGN